MWGIFINTLTNAITTYSFGKELFHTMALFGGTARPTFIYLYRTACQSASLPPLFASAES